MQKKDQLKKSLDMVFQAEPEKIEPKTSIAWLVPSHETWRGKTLELFLVAVRELRDYSSGKEKISWINLGYDRELERFILFFAKSDIQEQLNEYEGGAIRIEISETGYPTFYKLGKLKQDIAKEIIADLLERFKEAMLEMVLKYENPKTFEKVIIAFELEDEIRKAKAGNIFNSPDDEIQL